MRASSQPVTQPIENIDTQGDDYRMTPIRTLIMGAAGRDFHNFNVFFRDNSDYEVVAFTATQIPDIEGRTYPAALAGKLYPHGIPIYAESDLLKLIAEKNVDQVIFAYSDTRPPPFWLPGLISA
jgi:predicted GTPase